MSEKEGKKKEIELKINGKKGRKKELKIDGKKERKTADLMSC